MSSTVDHTTMAGGNIISSVAGDGEFLVEVNESSSASFTNFRIRKEKVISHVPIQVPEVRSPSDERIKTQIEDVDGEDLLHRLQSIEVKNYRYTEEWRKVRGIDDIETRGVIAQQVRKVFPEYVDVSPNLEYQDKDFNLEDFH